MKQIRWIVALVCLSFVEVAVTVLLTKYLGALLTYSLFAIPTTVGLFIQWRRKDVMREAWAMTAQAFRENKHKSEILRIMSRPEYAAAQAEVHTYWASVLLLAIPGPLTAAIAFCFMLPFVKKKIAQQDAAWAKRMEQKQDD
jgi:UPF0716 family protein affecting phage T7 exclusion